MKRSGEGETITGRVLEWVKAQGRPVHRTDVVSAFTPEYPSNHIDQILSILVNQGRLVRPQRGMYFPAVSRDRFPEHAKMYPYSQFDKIVEFFTFLRRNGIVDPMVGDDDLMVWIRQWRGVDELAYQAEVAELRSEYRHLWAQYQVQPIPGVMTGQIGTKVRVVDSGPPEQEPEPAVVVTGADDGLELLLTKLRRK